MKNQEKNIWGIHTRDEDLYLKGETVAIGWPAIGNLNNIDSNRDSFKDRFSKAYPDASKHQISAGAGMLYRFCKEVNIGDYVIFPSKSNREVNIGIIEGEYEFVDNQTEYEHTRKVRWVKHISRTYFSQGALYELGAAMSFFLLKNYADEFIGALDKNFEKNCSSDEEDDSFSDSGDEIMESTKDFILKELRRNLKGHDLEYFVADLLRAMGYRSTVSPHGGDHGIDITAYKDELPPRILVQVKSGEGNIKEATIQSLKGAMSAGDYGLFVTLSNYTSNASKYLKKTPCIRGINGSELVDLILKHYKDLSDKYKRIIPLKQIYIPVTGDNDNQ